MKDGWRNPGKLFFYDGFFLGIDHKVAKMTG